MKRKNILQSVRQMMRRLMIPPAVCILALLASCNTDDKPDDGRLPEGRYPMTFSTAVEGLTVTRANTAEGKWTTGDAVAVKAGSDVKQYTPVTGNASVTLQAASDVTPFYWQTSNETKTVSAWYSGTGYKETLPTTWAVQSDQSANDGYQQSDFLYAPATDITFASRNSTLLTFYHQLSKITMHVIRGEQTPANITDINAMTLGNDNFKHNGKFNLPQISGDNHYGTWTDADTPVKGTITARKALQATILAGKTALATFHALVIPQTVAGGQQLFALTAAGYGSPFIHKAKEGGTTWDPGMEYTYEVTIKGKTLSATLVYKDIIWEEDGNTGAGSVTLPPDKIYDLSTAGAVTINDDRIYLITGSGSNAVTISGGSPNVILQNATIQDNVINITGGTPKLVIKGNVTLTKGGIQMKGESTHVVIEGDGKLTATGIGSMENETCGNITIKGITAQINKRERSGGGIGGVRRGHCGNIKIENATINVENSHGAAAIGCGVPSPNSVTGCGNIEIIKSDITAYAGNFSASSPAAIGCCGSFGSNSKGICGNITITLKEGQTKEDFLSKLTVFHNEIDKVGLGGYDKTLRGKVGTITWKNANGQVIETVAARDVK